MNEVLQTSLGQEVMILILVIVLIVTIVLAFKYKTGKRWLVPHFAPTNEGELKSIIVAAFFIGLLIAIARASGVTWFSEWNAEQVIHIVAAVTGFVASIFYYKGKFTVVALIIMLISAGATLMVFMHIPSPIEAMMRTTGEYK